MRSPPIEGPIRRVPFISIEFIAMAFGRSSRFSRSWTKIDCRVGVSKALQMPPKRARAASCGIAMMLNPESAARIADCTAIKVSAAISKWRRLMRSPSTPANGEMKRYGALFKKPMSPVNHVEPERR